MGAITQKCPIFSRFSVMHYQLLSRPNYCCSLKTEKWHFFNEFCPLWWCMHSSSSKNPTLPTSILVKSPILTKSCIPNYNSPRKEAMTWRFLWNCQNSVEQVLQHYLQKYLESSNAPILASAKSCHHQGWSPSAFLKKNLKVSNVWSQFKVHGRGPE